MTQKGEEKRIFWVGTSLKDIKSFPQKARRDAGFALSEVQLGETPSDFKPMRTVGSGVYEIRVRGEDNDQYRVLYVAKYDDGIYVLHAFQKTSRKTERKDIALAKKRFEEVRRHQDHQ